MTWQERILCEWAVRRVIEQYCRYLDDGLYQQVTSLFADNATFATMGQVLQGRTAIAAFLGPGVGERRPRPNTIHLLTNCLVDIEGETACAESDWAMIRRSSEGHTFIELAGRYRDRLRLFEEGWLFTERTAVALARSSASPIVDRVKR